MNIKKSLNEFVKYLENELSSYFLEKYSFYEKERIPFKDIVGRTTFTIFCFTVNKLNKLRELESVETKRIEGLIEISFEKGRAKCQKQVNKMHVIVIRE